MSLKDTTSVLLDNSDKIAKWLGLADKYIQSYNDDPSTFMLPRAHAFLKPIIESYATNLEGFLSYVSGIRDSLPRQSAAYAEIQTVFRRINGRWTQQQRRERSARAVAKATELYGEIDYHTRQKWVADLEHQWAQRRLEYMDNASRGERLDMEERAELLAIFWDEIETEIFNGERLPRWN